jgi:RNA polymerase sigma-70 factor (ECF subfamily)
MVADRQFESAQARAAQVARASYGRLIGILSAQSGDIAAAEDALSDALQNALIKWPESGIPDNPEGWLVRVARNRMTDAHRRSLKQHPTPVEDHALTMNETTTDPIQDPRLGLLFVCAHPAISQTARTPLMLQTVLGFTAAEIARAYVGSPAAITKLLSRAKARIKANAIPFSVPDDDVRPDRLVDVTEAIYGCYALAWNEGPERETVQREAVFLADLLATQIRDDAEVLGLSALLALLHSRQDARVVDGIFVPLSEQNTDLWDHALIAAADARLKTAFQLGAPGRFQIEAAIQSVHAMRATTGRTDWTALLQLYDGLLAVAPTLGAQTSRVAVIGELHGATAGLQALDQMKEARVSRFQPYWATRAHLLKQSGQAVAAESAYRRAISLTHTGPVRDFLEVARSQLPMN